MAIKINIPNIGTDTLEVTEILVKIGDKINVNQPLIIIEGDKSSMEIPSPYSGLITELCVTIGDQVRTGSVILLLETKKNHTQIKSAMNKESSLLNDSNILKFLEPNNVNKPEYASQNNFNNQTDFNFNYNNNYSIHATPLVRQIARKLGVNLNNIQGSGRKGRITKEDIQNYLTTFSIEHTNLDSTVTVNPLLSTITSDSKINKDNFGYIDTIQLNKIQKISGSNLQKNWSTIPHVTQFDTVDVTNLEIFRKQQNLEITKKNINYKITILAFIIKAVAKALKDMPRFNSSLSKDGNTLILKKYINIGIAIDTEKGLIVPVLRNVDKKGIIQLSKELSEMAQKARAGNRLSPIDIQGGGFTISNLGGIGGGIAFTPIINAPEVAILGVSKSFMSPIWTENKFVPRLMLPLSLSYDHRVIDGADGARFMNLINKIIYDIRLLSM